MAAGREPFNVTGQSPVTVQQHSPWHSPVPYLFGGLAAMLGLIAFALLILACSYWKLSGYLDNGSREADLEAGEGKGDDNGKPEKPVFEEKILVIMAGDVKPTFLATPMSSRASSFDEKKSNSSGERSDKSPEKEEPAKEREDNQLERGNGEANTDSHQNH